jgi:hypothetical protein
MHRTGVKLFVLLLLFLLLLVMIVLRDGIGGHGKRHCGKQNYDSFFHVDVEAAVPPSLPKMQARRLSPQEKAAIVGPRFR